MLYFKIIFPFGHKNPCKIILSPDKVQKYSSCFIYNEEKLVTNCKETLVAKQVSENMDSMLKPFSANKNMTLFG